MKKIVTLFILLIGANVYAQNIDYNTIVLPSNAVDVEFSERLVQLAWNNNPSTEILNKRINIANYELKEARRDFLNNFKLQGNLNEFNLDPPNQENFNNFFPRYNFQVTFTLADFFNQPVVVNRKKEELEIEVQTMNAQMLAVRAEVLRRYQDYLTYQEILTIRTEALEDSYANYSIIEQSFKNGETSILQFNIAVEKYNDHREDKARAQGNFNIAKTHLEELIGVKLEDVE